jgi:hypothetical protein
VNQVVLFGYGVAFGEADGVDVGSLVAGVVVLL